MDKVKFNRIDAKLRAIVGKTDKQGPRKANVVVVVKRRKRVNNC